MDTGQHKLSLNAFLFQCHYWTTSVTRMSKRRSRPQLRSEEDKSTYEMMIVTNDSIFQIGRQFTFSNGSITVNTGALLAAGALALLGETLAQHDFISCVFSFLTVLFKVWLRSCFSCSPARTLATLEAAAMVTAMRHRTTAMETPTPTADP